MADVALRSPLRELAGGESTVRIDGSTVGEVIGHLERDYPRLSGWVLDEQGRIRRHVSVFVNGEQASLDASVAPGDRIHVLPAISGGAMMTETKAEAEAPTADVEGEAELLVGTRKGLFILRGARGGPMDIAARRFRGQIVEFAMRDPRTGTYYASVTHGQFGPRLYFTDDPAGEWEQAEAPAFPEDAGAAVERIWVIRKGVADDELWAGVAPAALFHSGDGGRTWTLNQALWDDPSRPSWPPGAGGLCLHSICIWPDDPDRLALGISSAGVWLTEDGGTTWRRGNKGLVARYLPEESREGATALCVHNMHRSANPERLFMQFHGGVYRSDDAGDSWTDIGSEHGLPSDFGFPMVVDPRETDHAYVIPLSGDFDRVTPEGQMRVFETKDGGDTWWPLADGLPQNGAYLTVLRQAFCHDGRRPLGLYFGAESGEVFGSADEGVSWRTISDRLAPVTSVRCSS